MTPYPTTFWVIHKRFDGASFKPGGEWGDLGDGPVTDWEDVLFRLLGEWPPEVEQPDRYDLRVWEIVECDGYANITAVPLPDILKDMRDLCARRGAA